MASAPQVPALPDHAPHRLIITFCTVSATLMQALDQTIANVALPYMQGSLSATYDEITWVLTSYITAAAIMTAPVGWLASRFGRKYLFITCLVGFTVASMMCGAAQSLTQMVVFRLLQGVFGAALVPLSQSTMIDIYPVEQRGKAMAIWGVGVMVGPILGPTLGGYLTEMYNWRYVFYINLPFGILATLGLIFFMPRSFGNFNLRFDWIGFGVLSLGIGGLQMMLDRGQVQDWFTSTEVIVEAVIGGLGIYLFVVHMITAKKPFIPIDTVQGPQLCGRAGADVRHRDDPGVQFVADGAVAAESGELSGGNRWADHGPAWHRDYDGHDERWPACQPVRPAQAHGRRYIDACLVNVGDDDLDSRYLAMDDHHDDHGAGRRDLGSLFLPLQVLAFATLPPQYRTDGASLFSLFRNIGSAVGVSVTSSLLAHNTQVLHEQIGASITPFNRALQGGGMISRAWNPMHPHGAALMDQLVNRQAQITAYIDDYWMMIFTTLPALALLFLLSRPKPSSPAAGKAHTAID